MRTTISIDDALLVAAKDEVRRRGQPFGRFVEDAVRRELNEPARPQGLALPVFHGGTGPAPGVDPRYLRALR